MTPLPDTPVPRALAEVLDLHRLRIARALAERTRYRYVQPRVVREGRGWKVVSPNCSRSVDPTGGEIDIAWFTPPAARRGGGAWMLHRRDHAQQAWLPHTTGALDELLDELCLDRAREFWR